MIIVILGSLIIIGASFTSVSTSSMAPTYQGYERTNTSIDIFNGDFVILQKKSPQIGDVILFKPQHDTKLYFHRVIAISNTTLGLSYLTKGDDNRYTDNSPVGNTNFGWVPEQNVVGVAIFTIHNVGWFINELFSINTLIPLLGIALLAFYYYYVSKDIIKKFLKKLKNKVNPNIQLKYKNRHSTISIKTVKSLSYGFMLIIIVLLPLATQVFNVATINPNVELLNIDDQPLSDSIELSNPHLSILEYYSYNQRTVDFVSIKMKITSAGYFNSIENVKIQVLNLNESIDKQNANYYYFWTATYSFTGTKIVNSDLIIPYNLYTGQTNTTLQIRFEYTVSHVFFADHIVKTQPLTVS